MTCISPLVFHDRGKRIYDFIRIWNRACVKAQLPARIFHDLRRSAVRRMVQSGVNQSVAMRISGHQSTSMFERYNIVVESDLARALEQTQAYREGKSKIVRMK